jgi:hypothetical protein
MNDDDYEEMGIPQGTSLRMLIAVADELVKCASQLGWTSSDDPKWIRRAEMAVEEYKRIRGNQL